MIFHISTKEYLERALLMTYIYLQHKMISPKLNLPKIELDARTIQSGAANFPRFTQVENSGLRRGGTIHVEATLVTAGSLRAGATYKGKQLEWWEENDRQEADIKAYARAKKVWINNTDTYLNKLYGEQIANGQEAKVWVDPSRRIVIKAVTTMQYPDFQQALDGVTLHNTYFPETALVVVGFGKDSAGDINMLVEQPFIFANSEGVRPSSSQLDQLAAEKGFVPSDMGLNHNYKNEEANLHDLHDENAILTEDNKLAGIDTTMLLNKNRLT